MDLDCVALENKDGSKLVPDRKKLEWKIEHKENNIKVLSVDSDDPLRYDVFIALVLMKRSDSKTVTNGNILIRAEKLKDIRTDIIIGERRSIAELEKEYSISADIVSGSESAVCEGGVNIDGGCWYYGNRGQSCDDVCSDKGGYNERTETYANNKGRTKPNVLRF